MGLLDRRRRIRGGIVGRAVVIGVPGRGAIAAGSRGQQLLGLRLAVRLPGRPAYEVELHCRAPAGKRPHRGQILPVLVDREDRSRVRIEWDRAPSLSERADRLIDRRRSGLAP
jgi:hypothetical protein